jgi:hypothetical protein
MDRTLIGDVPLIVFKLICFLLLFYFLFNFVQRCCKHIFCGVSEGIDNSLTTSSEGIGELLQVAHVCQRFFVRGYLSP